MSQLTGLDSALGLAIYWARSPITTHHSNRKMIVYCSTSTTFVVCAKTTESDSFVMRILIVNTARIDHYEIIMCIKVRHPAVTGVYCIVRDIIGVVVVMISNACIE